LGPSSGGFFFVSILDAAPKSIKGKSTAVELSAWADKYAIEKLIDTAVKETSK
jgi:hypothetical protein